ncbi:MAG: clostripain-related cysteine peptidase [Anaerolineae bacterium]
MASLLGREPDHAILLHDRSDYQYEVGCGWDANFRYASCAFGYRLLTALLPIAPTASWTFMLYLAGDSNLYGQLYPALQQLEGRAGVLPGHVVVLFDGDRNRDSVREAIQEIRTDLLGEVDMGDTQTLAKFITWAHTRYPAEHYYLAIADHGRGTTGVAWDYTPNRRTPTYLTPEKIRLALDQATDGGQWKIDILHYDTCLMAMVEDAYQVKNYVHYMIASQNLGWSLFAYDRYVAASADNPTPLDLATRIANIYFTDPDLQYNKPRTISVLDISRLDPVRAAVGQLADALRQNVSTEKANITAARDQSQPFDSRGSYQITQDGEYLDLYDLALHLKEKINDTNVRAAADGVIAAMDTSHFVVVNLPESGPWLDTDSYWRLDHAHGVSIYFPRDFSSPDYGRYVTNQLFRFTSESHWGDFLADYFGRVALPPGPEPEPVVPQMLQPRFSMFLPMLNLNSRGFEVGGIDP